MDHMKRFLCFHMFSTVGTRVDVSRQVLPEAAYCSGRPSPGLSLLSASVTPHSLKFSFMFANWQLLTGKCQAISYNCDKVTKLYFSKWHLEESSGIRRKQLSHANHFWPIQWVSYTSGRQTLKEKKICFNGRILGLVMSSAMWDLRLSFLWFFWFVLSNSHANVASLESSWKLSKWERKRRLFLVWVSVSFIRENDYSQNQGFLFSLIPFLSHFCSSLFRSQRHTLLRIIL